MEIKYRILNFAGSSIGSRTVDSMLSENITKVFLIQGDYEIV